MGATRSCSEIMDFKHIRKSLVSKSMDIYKARVCQIEKYIKKTSLNTPVLDTEYRQLKETLLWYEEKKRALRKSFPKSKLYDTGTFQPHRDLCLFVPLASFDNESEADEHLTKMIIAYLGDVKLTQAQCQKYYPYLLKGLNEYFHIELVPKDIRFLYNSLNDGNFLKNLLSLGRTPEQLNNN